MKKTKAPKFRYSDLLMVMAIVLNIFLLGLSRYVATSPSQQAQLAVSLSKESTSMQLFNDGLLISSLFLNGWILGIGVCLYLAIRAKLPKEGWMLNFYALMFFAVFLIFDLFLVGAGVPF